MHEKTFPVRGTGKINYMSQVAYDLIVADWEKIDAWCLLVTKLQEPFVKDAGVLTYNAWGFSTVLAWLVLLFVTDCVFLKMTEDSLLFSLQGFFTPFT